MEAAAPIPRGAPAVRHAGQLLPPTTTLPTTRPPKGTAEDSLTAADAMPPASGTEGSTEGLDSGDLKSRIVSANTERGEVLGLLVSMPGASGAFVRGLMLTLESMDAQIFESVNQLFGRTRGGELPLRLLPVQQQGTPTGDLGL